MHFLALYNIQATTLSVFRRAGNRKMRADHPRFAPRDLGFLLRGCESAMFHASFEGCREPLECATRGAARFPRECRPSSPRLGHPRPIRAGPSLAPRICRVANAAHSTTRGPGDANQSHATNETFAKFLDRHLGEVLTFSLQSRKRPPPVRFAILLPASPRGAAGCQVRVIAQRGHYLVDLGGAER